MGRQMRAVSNDETERRSRRDIPTVKRFNGTAHEGRRDIVEQERQRVWEGTHHVLSSKWHDLNAQGHGWTSHRNRVGEKSNTVLKQGRCGVFVSIDEETNEGLARTRLPLGGVFEAQLNLHVNHFTRSEVWVGC